MKTYIWAAVLFSYAITCYGIDRRRPRVPETTDMNLLDVKAAVDLRCAGSSPYEAAVEIANPDFYRAKAPDAVSDLGRDRIDKFGEDEAICSSDVMIAEGGDNDIINDANDDDLMMTEGVDDTADGRRAEQWRYEDQ